MIAPANAENQLEHALLQGRWTLFERLPAERHLAEELGVSRATLRTALSTLVGKGILETRRSKGTFVRALPCNPNAASLADSLKAMRIVMTPLLAAASGSYAPSVMLKLERHLPSIGMALHSGDMRLLAQHHLRFFSILLQAISNDCLAQAGAVTLPDACALARLLQECSQPRLEEIFKHLARTLHGLRHADSQACASSVSAYVTCLLQCLGEDE
ncbi:GntR family transcriptional regulator [Desulfovibrio sp. 86]|uniref:Transcriptional regulator, GntR family n=1 Tax=uncultured Desulfovibrio sp. TaxID=167968 RepID=A0A212L0G9_9BACT|nr:GntR family transcriptional regulator [Desulfovibrio sp. 86]SCM71071.1 Transcriptional regulator, GntR family [uncultured Desulfovibrio sp.]VZH32719.1 Transcriptional regulator, GntR family [Desulfovibrio sp. 86]